MASFTADACVVILGSWPCALQLLVWVPCAHQKLVSRVGERMMDILGVSWLLYMPFFMSYLSIGQFELVNTYLSCMKHHHVG